MASKVQYVLYCQGLLASFRSGVYIGEQAKGWKDLLEPLSMYIVVSACNQLQTRSRQYLRCRHAFTVGISNNILAMNLHLLSLFLVLKEEWSFCSNSEQHKETKFHIITSTLHNLYYPLHELQIGLSILSFSHSFQHPSQGGRNNETSII